VIFKRAAREPVHSTVVVLCQ